jgi:hypothetical protein
MEQDTQIQQSTRVKILLGMAIGAIAFGAVSWGLFRIMKTSEDSDSNGSQNISNSTGNGNYTGNYNR